MALSTTEIDPSAFYSDDKRFKRVVMDGMQYSNTDKGIVYFTLLRSGGNVTLSLYSNSKKQTASLVSQATVTESTTDFIEFAMTAVTGGTLAGAILLDDTDQTATLTGKLILTFTFDEDLKVLEKTIDDWKDSSSQWEGAGVASMVFVRAHRQTTKKIIEVMHSKLERRVQLDDADLPNLFKIFNMESLKSPAIMFCLYILYMNQANGSNPKTDPHLAKAVWYEDRFQNQVKSVQVHLDTNEDGKVDGSVGRNTFVWR